jgi:hypothetical protein
VSKIIDIFRFVLSDADLFPFSLDISSLRSSDSHETHINHTVLWQVSANFPEEQEKIGELLKKISALQDVRLRLGTEMADHSGLIRSLVVRAEDARLLDDM